MISSHGGPYNENQECCKPSRVLWDLLSSNFVAADQRARRSMRCKTACVPTKKHLHFLLFSGSLVEVTLLAPRRAQALQISHVETTSGTMAIADGETPAAAVSNMLMRFAEA